MSPRQPHTAPPFASVDEYLRAQPPAVRRLLQDIRAIVRAAAPDAEERISYQMPTFRLGVNIFHYAAHPRHIGIYPGPKAIAANAHALEGYPTSKGAIQLPLDRAVPRGLLKRLVAFNLRELRVTRTRKTAATPSSRASGPRPRNAAASGHRG